MRYRITNPPLFLLIFLFAFVGGCCSCIYDTIKGIPFFVDRQIGKHVD